jgi:type IV pilus assembly protein PilB
MASGTRPLLGQLLVRHGLITPAQLEEALRRQLTTGKLLGETLIEMGAIGREDLGRMLERQQQAASTKQDG